MTASVVFISYSHDSEVHREQVLGLLCSVSIAESARPLTPSACRTRAHAVRPTAVVLKARSPDNRGSCRKRGHPATGGDRVRLAGVR